MRNALVQLAALMLLVVSLGLQAGDVVTTFLHSTTESLIIGLSLGIQLVAAQTSIGSMIFSRRARPAATRVTCWPPIIAASRDAFAVRSSTSPVAILWVLMGATNMG